MSAKTFRIPKGSLEAAEGRWAVDDYLIRLDRDKAWKVTVEPWKGSRSISQNRLLFALYDDILELGGSDMEGWTKDDLHTFFKIEQFGSEVKEVFGRKRHVALKGTSGLTKPEMTDFIDGVVRFMAERGVVLELPGE